MDRRRENKQGSSKIHAKNIEESENESEESATFIKGK